MESKSPELILNEITTKIESAFGLNVYEAEANLFGFANLKWKISTDEGFFFIKQYNHKRYTEELLASVELALGLQDMLHMDGIPCPRILTNNGMYIQRTPSGERFMITNFCNGSMVNPGEVNTNQMYNLGQITGKMHKLLDIKAAPSLPLHWMPISKEAMLQQWTRSWHEALSQESIKYCSALEVQRKIIDEIDLDLFQSCEEGWVHWDLFVDNILFDDDQVSAILDFDRMHFIHPEFDISRAILSGCISNNTIHLESARAFIYGYTESIPLSVTKVVRSIKLTWWKEASWVNVNSEKSRTLGRFVDELIWVGDNWSRLEEIFSEEM